MEQIHKHWWLWRPKKEPQQQQSDNGDNEVEVVDVMTKPLIPLDPIKVKGKGRPVGAIGMALATSKKKGAGINSTKRLPSAFEYELENELATAVPAVAAPPSTAPATLGSKQKQVTKGKKQNQEGHQQRMVSMTSKKADTTPNPDVTSTKLSLQRLTQTVTDSYEPGTAAPRASARFLDALDVINPDVEDEHDAALTVADAAAQEDREEANVLEQLDLTGY